MCVATVLGGGGGGGGGGLLLSEGSLGVCDAF